MIDDSLSNNDGQGLNGGSISNAGTIEILGNELKAGVIHNNTVAGNWGNVYGGAVYNTGFIGAIFANFENNGVTTAQSLFASTEGHGGAIYNNGTISQIGWRENFVKFSNNFADPKKIGTGGAISNASGATIQSIYADFVGNYANADGGAVFNEGTINLIGQSDRHSSFKENTSGLAGNARGGAISNENGGRISTIYADFEGNSTYQYGGAINNYGSSASKGSWIGLISGSFISNTFTMATSERPVATGAGGAICNIRSAIDSVSNSLFQQNGSGSNSYQGRGGAIFNAGTITSISDSSFIANKVIGSSSQGGAIFNGDYSSGVIDNIQNVVFDGNKVGGSGGGIHNSYVGKIHELSNVSFSENNAGLYGGAIHNEGEIDTISYGVFKSNSAYEGGAVNNDAKIGKIINNVFEKNKADRGGAISNYGSIEQISGTAFIGNVAEGDKGGAIYNSRYRSITFTGSNALTNNTAAGKPNDITNDGDLNFGIEGNDHIKTTIGSGIDGTGSINLNSGELVVSGKGTAIKQAQANFKGGTNVVITVSDRNVVLNDRALHASEVGNLQSQTEKSILHTTEGLTIADDARLTIAGANAGMTYIVASDTGPGVNNAGDGWRGVNLIDSSNVLLEFQRVDGDAEKGTVMVTSSAQDAAVVLPCVDIPNNLNVLSSSGKIDANSDLSGIRFLSRATDKQYLSSGLKQMEEVINSAAQVGTAGAVKNITYSGTGMFNRTINKRLSLFGAFQNGKDSGLWVDVVGMHQRNQDMSACSGKTCGDKTRFGHSIDMGGIVAGIDASLGTGYRVGLAVMAGTGSASSKGDFSRTTNDTDFWGVSAYSSWNKDNWNIMGNVSYVHFDNDVDQYLESALQMGNKLTADISSYQLSMGFLAEYRIQLGNAVDLLPHLGVRYDRLVASGFKTDSDGGTVFNTSRDAMDIYSVPLGVGIQGTFNTRDDWVFKPQADLTCIFAEGDTKDHTKVSAVGLEAFDSIRTRIVDRTSVAGGVGFELQKDNTSISVHYDAMYSSRQMWQGLLAKVVYLF